MFQTERSDEYHVEVAHKVEEALKLVEVGFNYITEKNGIMLFRKPKRFNG